MIKGFQWCIWVSQECSNLPQDVVTEPALECSEVVQRRHLED